MSSAEKGSVAKGGTALEWPISHEDFIDIARISALRLPEEGKRRPLDKIAIEYQKLAEADPSTLVVKRGRGGKIDAYSAVIPTSRRRMKQFAERHIDDNGVRREFQRNPQREARVLYVAEVAAALTNKRGGFDVARLLKAQLSNQIDARPELREFYAWPVTIEGERLIRYLEEQFGIHIQRVREKPLK